MQGRWLGAQRWSELPEDAAAAWVQAALEAGVDGVDLANVYGPETEPHRGEALWGRLATGGVCVATKGGLVRSRGRWVPDGRAKALEQACEDSRRRLGVDALDLYQLHAPDPRVKWGTSVRALARLQARGHVRRVGLCNVSVGQLRVALDVVDVASVQVAVSPFDAGAARSGVVEEALQRGIPVLAWRPLGGPAGVKRLGKSAVVRAHAERLRVSGPELALAWLRSLGLIPLPGPTRPETVRSSLTASVILDDAALTALDAAFEVGPLLRTTRAERAPDPEDPREVVILVGSPGAGKTTWRRSFDGEHLSRDEAGGRLAGLIPHLDARLAAGATRVALDGTYPTRASRSRVVEAAWRHGVPVRCVWVPTDPGRCEVQVVHRMLDALGRLPLPEDLQKPEDPALVPPRALLRFRQQLEPPEVGEGFTGVERHDVPPRAPDGPGRALVLDAGVHLVPEAASWLRDRYAEGFVLVALGWAPGGRLPEVPDLGIPVDVRWCVHAAGPPVCWCRKPWPGLVVAALRDHALDPAHSAWVITSAADRTLSHKVGIAPWTGTLPTAGRA